MTPPVFKTPYVTPFFRALFNGSTVAQEEAVDRLAPPEYWACVGIDPAKLKWLKEGT